MHMTVERARARCVCKPGDDMIEWITAFPPVQELFIEDNGRVPAKIPDVVMLSEIPERAS
jgi:hypothetical protein